MKVKILEQVNSHWTDGRHLSAGIGAEVYVADDDKDAVDHLKHLVKTKQAELIKDEPASEQKKAGRPPLPRDEAGKIVRTEAAE